MDTVYTSKKDVYKPSLLVLTERMTRYELIFKMRDRTAGSVVRVLNALERSLGVQNFRKQYSSITVDNGSEFADVEGLEKSCRSVSRNRTKMYYCHSHQSWERGSNENANKLIRRHFPKGTDFSQVSATEIAEVQDWINHYPREILNWDLLEHAIPAAARTSLTFSSYFFFRSGNHHSALACPKKFL